jgi:ribose/xylose/arabinose/galactoside ABC-type transport system permease subunit
MRLAARITPGVWLLAALVVALAISAPGFLSGDNLLNLGRTASILALAASAQAIVIIIGGLDLSAGSAVALMSVVAVLTADQGPAAGLAFGAAALIGVAVLNGFLVSAFEASPFLVTLGMLTAIHGLASELVGGIPVEAPPGGAFSWAASSEIAGVPVAIVLGASGLAALGLLLGRTALGRSWYLLGANPVAARAAGIRIRRATFLAYALGGLFLALAGLILTARVHSGQPNLQPTLAFEAIAACAIGGLSLNGGTGRASGVLVGVLVITITQNGLRLLNWPSQLQLIAIGTLMIVAVLAQRAYAPGRGGPRAAARATVPRTSAAVPE